MVLSINILECIILYIILDLVLYLVKRSLHNKCSLTLMHIGRSH